MSETVIIILPLPPSVLSPNRPPGPRGGRMAWAAAAPLRLVRRLHQFPESLRVQDLPWTLQMPQKEKDE